MTRVFYASLLTLLIASSADAGPLRRSAPSAPRFPRVNNALRMAVVPYPYNTPGVPVGSPYRPFADVVPQPISLALTVLAFTGSDVFTPLSWGVPPALRTARVVLFGSPAVGPPRDTLIWIASPFALRVTHRLRERNGLDPTGGQVLWLRR